MARPGKREALIRQARETGTFTRVALPAKVTCPACARDFYPDADGRPRPHERPSRPGEHGHSPDVPTYVTCEGIEPMTLTFDELPPDVAAAFEYAVDRDAQIDAGVAVSDVPSYAEWKASHDR